MRKITAATIILVVIMLTLSLSVYGIDLSSSIWFDTQPYIPTTTANFESPFRDGYGNQSGIYPVNEKFNQLRPFRDPDDTHRGIDISSPLGTDVYAAYTGTVTAVVSNGDESYIVIRHDYDTSYNVTRYIYSIYMHLYTMDVAVNQNVTTGQKIGKSGPLVTTRYGRHLHLGIATSSSINYGNMKYTNTYMFFNDMPVYNSGGDFDYLYNYSKSGTTVNIYGYFIPDSTSRYTLSAVKLYYRVSGASTWSSVNMTAGTSYRFYYNLGSLGYSSGTTIQYFFVGLSNTDTTPEYERWSYYPAKYKVPSENPNTTLWNYTYMTYTY